MVFSEPKRVYVAYADQEGRNEFLIRDGKRYFVLTSRQKVFPISAYDAYRTLKLIEEQILSYRGFGKFMDNIKIGMKGANK